MSRPTKRPVSTQRHRAAAATTVVALALLVGCSKANSQTEDPPTPPSPIAGLVEVQNLPHTHYFSAIHYSHTPPLGGAHNPVPLNCGIYDKPVENENAVHSMEHGAVWITYKPGVDIAPLKALADTNPSYTLVSPYPSQPQPVMIQTWGAQLGVTSPSDPRLAVFVKTYAGGNQGGEQGASCLGYTPDQAADAIANPPRQDKKTPPNPGDSPG